MATNTPTKARTTSSPTATHRRRRGLAALALMLLPAVAAPLALALPDPLGLGLPPLPVGPKPCLDLLLNTGTQGVLANQPFAVNAPGVADLKWILTSAPTGVLAPAVATNPYPGWMANNGNEMWITPILSYDANTGQPLGAPAGVYTYDFHFFMPEQCRERAAFKVCFAADNGATLSLNGSPLAPSTPYPYGFKAWTCTGAGGNGSWTVGLNVLRATVTNQGGPTGFIAEGVLNV